MEYEIMYLCNVIGVGVLFMIAAFTLIGVDKEKNTEAFEMWVTRLLNIALLFPRCSGWVADCLNNMHGKQHNTPNHLSIWRIAIFSFN